MTVNTNGPQPDRPPTEDLGPDEGMVIYGEGGEEIHGTRRDGWAEVPSAGIAPDSSYYQEPLTLINDDQRWDPTLPPAWDDE